MAKTAEFLKWKNTADEDDLAISIFEVELQNIQQSSRREDI
jgi:hypothetical protein